MGQYRFLLFNFHNMEVAIDTFIWVTLFDGQEFHQKDKYGATHSREPTIIADTCAYDLGGAQLVYTNHYTWD